MRINHTKIIHGALFLALASLAACGGGGGGGGGTPPAITYTIGGTVNGLTGAGLVLQNNGGDNLSISAGASSFTFSTHLANNAAYSVTVQAHPAGQTCTVSSATGTVSAANVTNVAVTCIASATVYTIGGTVSGLTGTGLVLQNNGGDNLSVSAGAPAFTFATPQASGSSYQVTVQTQPSGQNCTVSSSNGIVSAANVTNVAVSCTTSASTYTIGGTVSNLTGTGLVLRNNGGDNLAISANGNFVFATPQLSGSTYQVTVLTQPTGQTCAVTPVIGAVAGANVTSVSVSCAANTYTIGGTVTGLSGTGLVLQNNGGNNLSVSASASTFTFTTPIASGATYNVTVLTQPGTPTQTCTVNSPSGTVATANVTNVSVICSIDVYSIGGTVTGLTGSGLVLQNNGGDNLAAASGVYAFATQLASGSTYNVTVLTQPTSPAQICTVANATGPVTAAVTNANVSCVNTYTIGGTITGEANGIGPTLQNNLGDNLFIPSITTGATSFTFSTPLLDGATYSVTQRTRARAPSQDCSAITGGVGTVSGADVIVSITCARSTVDPKFAFVANSTANSGVGAADTVSAYTIAAAGDLTAATTPTTASGDGPNAIAVDPIGQFAYAVNSKSDSISAYGIDSNSGILTALTDVDGGTAGNQTSIATGDNPISIAVHPTGKFAYVAQGLTNGSLAVYSINITSGALSATDADGAASGVQATIATGTAPYAASVDPLGKFAYVANYGSNTISAYTINQTSGALTPDGTVASGTGPSSIAIEPTGKCALVSNNSSNNVMSYSINPTTGALTLVTTTAAIAGSAPRSVAIDPNTGLYAYVANAGTSTVSAYSVDPATCVIAPIDTDAVTGGVQASIAAGSVPISVNVDPSGQFVYVANYSSNNISVYGIAGGSGALTLQQTLSTGSGPVAVTTTQ